MSGKSFCDEKIPVYADIPLMEGMPMPVFTQQSSIKPSPMISALSPRCRPQDITIPSIQHPKECVGEVDATTPRSLPPSDLYHGMIDAFKGASLDLPRNDLKTYQIGQNTHSSESSPFTFRKMHNATPDDRNKNFKEASDASGSESCRRKLSLSSGLGFVPPQSSSNSESPTATKPTMSVPLAKDETTPDEPYFNEDFQTALRNGKNVATRIASILKTCDLASDSDSQVFNMIQTAHELEKFDAPSVCTIGIVGDSGAGKSSLINSLLDEDDIAKTSGLGQACTKVVTEYRYRKSRPGAKYTVEVDRMTCVEISEHLKTLLWSYRLFHDPHIRGDSPLPEQSRLENQSRIAWETLSAAFGSRNLLTESFLQDTTVGAEDRICQQLAAWTDELQWPQDSADGWYGSANTMEELSELMEPFVDSSLYPFIKVIRVYLSSPVLQSGAILADLPGFHDANRTHVKAAEEYLYGCDEILVVADGTRCGTNKNVEKILQQSLGSNLGNGKPSQGISFVCSKSDLVTPKDAREIRKKTSATSRTEAARIKVLVKELEEASNANSYGRVKAAEDELKFIDVITRNHYLEKLVQDNYKNILPGHSLSTFSVSSLIYEENCQRADDNRMLIDASGIQALRNHCHKIPSKAQFRIAHHFLTVSLKALVQRVQMWLAGGSRETMLNDATVQKLLETLQHDLQKSASVSISAAADAQKAASRDIMIQPMTRNLTYWTQEAIEISHRWVNYHPSQILALCVNEGLWYKEGVPRAGNLELIKSMVDTMDPWWDTISERSESSLIELQSTILRSLEGLISRVKDFQGASLFAEALSTKIDSIKKVFEDAEKEMASKMDLIKRNATGNNLSSYICEEMHPAWNDCNLDSSRSAGGVTARRRTRLAQAIGTVDRPVLFKAIRSRVRKALNQLVAETSDKLEKEIRIILQQISSDIELLHGSEAKILAKNGDFLKRLEKVVANITGNMDSIGEIAARVKDKADNGVLF